VGFFSFIGSLEKASSAITELEGHGGHHDAGILSQRGP
jgi:hypothetical protein